MKLGIAEQMGIVEGIVQKKAKTRQPQQNETNPDKRSQRFDELDVEGIDAPTEEKRGKAQVENEHRANRKRYAEKMHQKQGGLGHDSRTRSRPVAVTDAAATGCLGQRPLNCGRRLGTDCESNWERQGASGHFVVMTAVAGATDKDTIILEHMRAFGQGVVCTISHAGIELHIIGGDEIPINLDRSKVVTIMRAGALVRVKRDDAV